MFEKLLSAVNIEQQMNNFTTTSLIKNMENIANV